MNNKLALFNEKEIRKIYKNNKWYYSVIDIISKFTNSSNPSEYLKKLKQKDTELTNKWNQLCISINMPTKDGKIRKVIASDTEGILRIIESIHSKESEPIKTWLARLGRERLEEINNPELAMDKMKNLYEQKGYSKNWIEQREREITSRHSLKEEWEIRGIKTTQEYLILMNEIYKNNFGISIQDYKCLKGIEDNNLKDSMTNIELAIINLLETTTVELHKKHNSQGIDELTKDIEEMSKVFTRTTNDIENKLERTIVSSENYANLTHHK